MNRLLIDLDALRHNYRVVSKWVAQHGGSPTVVTKALCGHADLIRALNDFGVNSMGDSRIENLRAIRKTSPSVEAGICARRTLPRCISISRCAMSH